MDKLQRKYRRKRQITSTADAVQFHKLKRYLLIVLIIFLTVWTSISFVKSDFFSVELFSFDGNNYTTEAEIRHAMQITEGENIWKLSLPLLEERIQAIPRVETVSVTRRLPRTLNIKLQERKMLVLIPFQEYFLEIGWNGQILGTTQATQNYDLPLLTGVAPIAGTVGQMLLTAEDLHQVQQLSEALKEEGVMISEINLEQADNLIIVTMDGLSVWLGVDNFVEKANILLQITGQLNGKQAEGYLDLRAATAPVFHPLKDEKNKKNN
ncbi:MAG TPA: FtsQ-type POTRA domain-containing protein [Oscillospiraceae bacterium]|nr:FtsQ-type POTRA domain-containing protein [Oscillospiraceae bacterium]